MRSNKTFRSYQKKIDAEGLVALPPTPPSLGRVNPYTLTCVPEQYMAQEMCNMVMHINPAAFFVVPVHFKAQEMCDKAVQVDPWQLESIPDHFKTLGI